MLHALFVKTVCAGFSLGTPVIIIFHSDDGLAKEWFEEILRLVDLVGQLVMLFKDVVGNLRVVVPDSDLGHLVHNDERVLLCVESPRSPLNLVSPVAANMRVSLIRVVFDGIHVFLEAHDHTEKEGIVARVGIHALLDEAGDLGHCASVPNRNEHNHH